MASSSNTVNENTKEATSLLQPPATGAVPKIAFSKAYFLSESSPGRFWVIYSQISVMQFIVFFDATTMSSSHPAITS
jgi:hypothetical protein